MSSILAFLLAVSALGVLTHERIASAAVDDDLRDGDGFFEHGEWQKAAAAFDRAIAKAPGQVSARAYGKRAAIFIIVKDYQGGLDFLAKAKARHPAAPEVLEQEALILWETGHRDEAIKVAERVVVTKPETFTNQQLIGEYYAARDPVRTAAAYEAYLANRPADLEQGDVVPRVRLGFAYLASARLAIARADEPRAHTLYSRAADQFETVQRRLGKRPNAQTNADNGLCAAYTGLGRFDQAVTVCERIIKDPRRIDATGSVWFNLSTAYLARKQTRKARTAATEFIRLRKSEARGYTLVGDTYFADRDWSNALEQYLRAQQLQRPNQPHDQVMLSIRLGKTYRRLPAPATGPNPNLALAIAKLAAAVSANPESIELAIEVGGAYLEAKQDAKAIALTDRLLGGAALAKAPAELRASVLVVAGKALFNQRKLKEARQRFEAAQQVRPTDVTIQRALVLTINEQAFEAGLDRTLGPRAAQALLEQGLAIDPASPVTLTNLAILAIDRGDCDAARQLLGTLEPLRGHDPVIRTRLVARTWLCGSRPDPKQASEAFAVAEREARKVGATLALAEIYTEWAPLLWDGDLGGAIAKLEQAVASSAQQVQSVDHASSTIGSAAKRNLALALVRRGWQRLGDGKAAEAALDFERATRDPGVLKGTEPLAVEFAHAMALVEANRAGDAVTLLEALAARGNQGAYLQPTYVRVGPQFFAAYARYRNGPLVARQRAVAELGKLEAEPGAFGDKIRQLLASAWEVIAYDQWRAGQRTAAAKSLLAAAKHAGGGLERRVAMGRMALALRKTDIGALEALRDDPPEALVNLGIAYELAGRPKDAFDAWSRVRGRTQSRDLHKWIDAKKRIYGF